MYADDFLKLYEDDLQNIALEKQAGMLRAFRAARAAHAVRGGSPVVNRGAPARNPRAVGTTARPAGMGGGKPLISETGLGGGTPRPPKPTPNPTPAPKPTPNYSDRFAQQIANKNVPSSRIIPKAMARSAWSKVYNVFAEPWTFTAEVAGYTPGLGKLRKAMNAIDRNVGMKFTPEQYSALSNRYGTKGKIFSAVDNVTDKLLTWGSRAAVGNYVLSNLAPNLYIGDNSSEAGRLQTKIMQGIRKPLAAIYDGLQAKVNGKHIRVTPFSYAMDYAKKWFINENKQDIDAISDGVHNKNYNQVLDGVRHLTDTNPAINWVLRKHYQAALNNPSAYGDLLADTNKELIPDEYKGAIGMATNFVNPDWHLHNVDNMQQYATDKLDAFNQYLPGATDRGIEGAQNYIADSDRPINAAKSFVNTQTGNMQNNINNLDAKLHDIDNMINDPTRVQNGLNRVNNFINTQTGRFGNFIDKQTERLIGNRAPVDTPVVNR